jgi:PAS domain S-box-containing protein
MTVMVVVDDRLTNRKILAKLAASLEENALVKSFADPAEALAWVKDNTPDLVITDFKMPGMDGAGFTRNFRRQPLCYDVPVMVVTVFEDRDFRYRALEAGATDFLLSPIDHREFRVRARNLLTLRKQQQLIKKRASELEQRLRTDDRLYKQKMRQTREQLLSVVDAVPAMICATDEHSRCIFINRYMAAFLGINPDDAVGKTIIDLVGEVHGHANLELDRSIMRTGEAPPPFEEEYLDRSGERRIFLTTKRPMRDETGRMTNVVTVALDITDRKRAEIELAEQKNFLRTTIDNDPSFIFTTDKDGRFTMANKAFAQACGLSVEGIVGTLLADIKGDPDEVARLSEDDRTFLKDLRSIAVSERPFTTADGLQLWLQFTKVRFTLANGEDRVLTVGADITERREVEETLRRMKEGAEAANRSKTEFLANMSHELRTPLNAIIGFSKIIEEGMFGPVGNAKYLEYATDIGTSADHLLSIINDILEVSKIEAGEVDLQEQLLDVGVVFRDVERIVHSRADEAGIRFEVGKPDSLPALYADERKIKQILLNLVSNGIKFTPAGGFVRVEARLGEGGGIEIEVRDNGIGIAEEDIPRALERFGQVADVMTRKHSGTGLGLPLAIGMVELHGGRLEITSEVGKGTTVTVKFPPDRTVAAKGADFGKQNA